jgi:hypothetical protein
MVSTFRWHRKPLFWILTLLLAAFAAYATLQQVTFVPGVPVTGHVQVYLVLLALWFVGILAVWFILQLLRFLVRR